MSLDRQQTPSAETVARGYEPGGVHNGALVAFLLGLGLMLIAVLGLTRLLLNYRLASRRVEDVSPTHVPLIETSTEPALQPSPAHDTLPYQDLASLRQAENTLFRQLGWSLAPGTNRPIIPSAIVRQLAARRQVPGSTVPVNKGAQ